MAQTLVASLGAVGIPRWKVTKLVEFFCMQAFLIAKFLTQIVFFVAEIYRTSRMCLSKVASMFSNVWGTIQRLQLLGGCLAYSYLLPGCLHQSLTNSPSGPFGNPGMHAGY
jgi:hypothetical protein